MIHQVSGGAQGTASDVERTIGFMFNLKQRLNRILSEHTGKTIEEVERDADRDNYMTSEESAAYGLVDKVLENRTQHPLSLLLPPSNKARLKYLFQKPGHRDPGFSMGGAAFIAAHAVPQSHRRQT